MIDTESKRRSVQAYTLGLMRPVADGTIDTGDKATCAWLYSGLGYSPPTPSNSGINIGTGLSPTELATGIGGSGISRPDGLTILFEFLFGGLRDRAFS